MTAHLLTLSTVTLLWTVGGCNHISGSDASGTDVDLTDADTDTGTAPAAVRPLAGGLRISKVSMFQGVEAVLVEDGEAPTTIEMPVIIGRPGLLRVFVDPDSSFQTRKITAILTVHTFNDDTVLETTLRVTGPSRVAEVGSTLNFDVPGEALTRTSTFSVSLVEETVDGPGGGTEQDATWLSDETGGLDMQLTDDLTIVLVPVRYNADGSGRLPDTGPAQVQRIADLTMGMYPAQSVSVRVDPPLDWPRTIAPFDSNDWTDVLDTLIDMRGRANEAPNTYYYGMFNPEASINDFCRQGCILGLSYLAYNTQEFFRASVGVGYSGDIASETLVHEVGHAHGREHAPCGLYGQPSDRNYPYANAALGSWGYDVVTKELFEPTQTVDMMSYCSPIWVSDYTFYALYERMQDVGSQARRAAPTARTALKLNADGTSTMRSPVQLGDTMGAPRVEVDLFDALGAPAGRTTAAFFPYDHVPGGLVALDEVLPVGFTATVVSTP